MKKSFLALPLVAMLALTGCSGSDKVTTFGETLNVKISAGDTKAKVDVTVTDISSAPISDVPEIELDAAYADGELFMVQYTAKVTDGNYEGDGTYFFSDKKWAAGGTEDIATVSTGYFGKVEVPGCEMFSTEHAEQLSAGNEIQACQLFASTGSGAEIDQVVYGQPQISYKGRNKGWQWTAE